MLLGLSSMQSYYSSNEFSGGKGLLQVMTVIDLLAWAEPWLVGQAHYLPQGSSIWNVQE